MPPSARGPYSLSSLGGVSSNNTLNWQFQPYQLNSSGTLPGTTSIGINGQGVVISGPNSSITVADPSTQNTVISILGKTGYILFTDPNTKLNQIIIGKLPDGTFGLVISKPGIDVLQVFS